MNALQVYNSMIFPVISLIFWFLCACRKTGRIMLWRCLSVRGHWQFSGLFFVIFTAIGLKLAVLLCSQELLFQFAFGCDWFIFARVMPLEQQNLRFFQFSGLFFAIFAAIGLKLGVLLCSQEILWLFGTVWWHLFSVINSSHTFRLTSFKPCTVIMDRLKMCMWLFGRLQTLFEKFTCSWTYSFFQHVLNKLHLSSSIDNFHHHG
jgi:hypothetical protein